MATAGNLIQQANFSTAWTMEYKNKSYGDSSWRYLYVCAPCWYAVVTANYHALWQSGIVHFRAFYYNGETWQEGISETVIDGSNGNLQRRFGHNRDENNRTGYCDNSYPLWRLEYRDERSNGNWDISFYAGSWGLAVDTSGNPINYPKSKRIYSRGRAGTTTLMHDSGTSNDDTNVLNNIFNSENRRGSPILASEDSELINIPWKP